MEVKFQKMVIAWLKAGNDCDWKNVCDALSHPTVGMQHMAKKLRDSQENKSQTADGWLCHFKYSSMTVPLHTTCIACTLMSIIAKAIVSLSLLL